MGTNQRNLRVAVDIGGTFTDLVLTEAGNVVNVAKVLTVDEDPAEGVRAGLEELVEPPLRQRVTEIVHGTTLVSNALIQRKGARTGLITTAGFRDVLLIRNELRYELYDLAIRPPRPLIPRKHIWEFAERTLADGTVDLAPDMHSIPSLCRRVHRSRIESLAICLLHSYVNPSHEHLLANALSAALPDVVISCSSDVAPELGEYRRASTTVANAFVRPLVRKYLTRLEELLLTQGYEAPLRVMLSTGGRTSVAVAKRHPIGLVESGPAGGVMSARFWGSRVNRDRVLAFDMGGTTAKAGIIEGEPLIETEHEVARVDRLLRGSGLPLRVPVVDLIEIGAGGGSIARVDRFGLPKVGPDSAGASPGPASYGKGGTQPTVTDADLLLGYLNPDFFLGGRLSLDIRRAEDALATLDNDLGFDTTATAAAIHRVVNENMAAAARMHAIEKGVDLRSFALVPTGGAGPVHAWGLAHALGIERILCPPSAGVASAFGMLTAPQTFDFSRSLPSVLDEADWASVHAAIKTAVEEGEELLRRSGVDSSTITIRLSADVRHLGQGATLTIPLSSPLASDPTSDIERTFAGAYTHLYGHQPPGIRIEVLTWRVQIAGPQPPVLQSRVGASAIDTTHTTPQALKGRRLVYFPEAEEYIQTDVYDRYKLAAGQSFDGPAVIEERESTVIVGPSGRARVHAFGVLEVDVALA